MRRLWLVTLALSMAVGICHAQEEAEKPEAVDMKDPVAVVRAYLAACRAGDVAGAFGYVTGDEETIEGYRDEMDWMKPDDEAPHETPLSVLTEVILLPCSSPVEVALGGTKIDGGRATIPVSLKWLGEATFALVKAADGAWKIDQEKSIVSASGRRGPVDDGDPAAVVEAYLQACRAGEAGAAFGLVAAGDAIAEGFGGGRDMMLTGGMLTGVLPYLLRQMAALPTGFPLEVTMGESEVNGDQATVRVDLNWPVEAAFVLTRAADGAWRVALEETIFSTTGNDKSVFAEWARESARWRRPEGEEPGETEETAGIDESRWFSYHEHERLAGLVVAYAAGHDGRLPQAETWRDDVERFCLDSSALDGESEEEEEYGCALNANLAGTQLAGDDEARAGTVILFECADLDRNAHGDPHKDLFCIQDAKPPAWVAFADGTVSDVPPDMTGDEALQAWEQTATCETHVTALCQALLAYARDHDGFLPEEQSWCDDILPYLKPEDRTPETFKCPAVPDFECGYVINADLAGTDVRVLRYHDTHVLLLPSQIGLHNESRREPETPEEGEARHWARVSAHSRWEYEYYTAPEPTVIVGLLSGEADEGYPYAYEGDFDDMAGEPEADEPVPMPGVVED